METTYRMRTLSIGTLSTQLDTLFLTPLTYTGIIDPGQRCRDVHHVPYQVDTLDSQAAGEQPRPQPQHGAQPYAQSEIVDMKRI